MLQLIANAHIPHLQEFVLPLLGSMALAFMMPVGILVTRDNVKSKRQQVIQDLEEFFQNTPDAPSGKSMPTIIPSFEFVKTKYYLGGSASQNPRYR